tara:strand:- start:255 stop:503 length:249 start_codon:yes stop_codon:yes gene_type:complete
MNNQALRVLSMLPHYQLLGMYEETVSIYNTYCHQNDDKDDIGGHIAMQTANMELDIKLLERATHDAYLMENAYVNEYIDLPF